MARWSFYKRYLSKPAAQNALKQLKKAKVPAEIREWKPSERQKKRGKERPFWEVWMKV